MRRWGAGFALAAFVAGCIAGSPSPGGESPDGDSPPPSAASPMTRATSDSGSPVSSGSPRPSSEALSVPTRLSPADDGGTFTMTVGQTAGFVIPDPLAPDPAVEGDAVEVVEVANVAASGQREWELRGVRPGSTVLRGAGDVPYEIRLVVSGP